MKMLPYEAFACRYGAEDVVLRELYKSKTREERVRLLVSSPRASTTPSYSPGPSMNPSYSPGPSTPPSYSPGPSTPLSYSPGPSRNVECSNCKIFLREIKIHQYIILHFTWWKEVDIVALAQLESNSEGHYKKQFVLCFICKVEDSGNMWSFQSKLCAELREAAGSNDWVEMLVLYCWRSVEKDFRVAGVINKLCEEVVDANEETSYFIQELDDVPGWVVATRKTSVFLKETQEKDNERLQQLEALAREIEARAREKCIFIEKLKVNQPF
ncbi:hypothetical protein Tco_1296005 [Tanacetum coccineum]|uniref:FRIGIDA-like protein n=1 Tax=Tanacetum coccineum TaxID=301880 RepID=A0ABQ4ZRZ5_9ASTR